MKFKITLKAPRDPQIGDIIEITNTQYVIVEFRDKRIWGKRVDYDTDKLTHICGIEYFKQHILSGKIKLINHVQD